MFRGRLGRKADRITGQAGKTGNVFGGRKRRERRREDFSLPERVSGKSWKVLLSCRITTLRINRFKPLP